MKDLRDDHTVDCSDLVRVDMKELKEHHFVRKGDLVLRTRGLVTTSAILLEAPEHVVVSAPLLRIRISRPDKVLPEYLNWYIGQREAQIFLNSRANTTAQKMIGKEAIDDLEVILPSIERQKCIVEIASLSAREQCLLQELAEKRGQYSSIVLMRLAKGEQE
jgi:restriction endonuclease S subunit